MANNICPHCGSRIQQVRKENLTKAIVIMLKRVAQQVVETGRNDVELKDCTTDGEFKLFSNFSHLRYHGLVANVKIDSQVHRKRWLVTRNGWAFLRGEIELPKFRMVKNGHNVSSADQRVYLKDVWYGEPNMQTTFEYFDDDGKAVGWRPTLPMPAAAQARLL